MRRLFSFAAQEAIRRRHRDKFRAEASRLHSERFGGMRKNALGLIGAPPALDLEGGLEGSHADAHPTR